MSIRKDRQCQLSRRSVIRATVALLAAGPALVSPVLADSSCSTGGEEQNDLRESLHYVDSSPDKTQECHLCAYFSAANDKHCGHCQLLNGSVAENGRCDSWSPKQK